MWALLLPFGRGIEGLWDSTVWWACPPSRVTFEPCQVLLWAWHGVKGEAMAVNEAEHTTGIVWKVRREERLRRCEVGVTVVGWCCHCLLYTSPSPRDATLSRMPSSA